MMMSVIDLPSSFIYEKLIFVFIKFEYNSQLFQNIHNDILFIYSQIKYNLKLQN